MTQERILIIDGDISLSEVLKTRLGARGYLVEYSPCADEALDILGSKWVDLIILSVVLQGGKDGYQLFKEIRKKKAFSRIPIVIQSKKPAMKEAFQMIGAESFFAKPYPMTVFLEEIKKILVKIGGSI